MKSVIALSLTACLVVALSPLRVSYEHLAKLADSVAIVRVLEVKEQKRTERLEGVFIIDRQAKLQIEAVIRGDLKAKVITYEYQSIEASNETVARLRDTLSQKHFDFLRLSVSDSLVLRAGGEYLVFLKGSGDATEPVAGGASFRELHPTRASTQSPNKRMQPK